jgi:uncharacterized protein YoxC
MNIPPIYPTPAPAHVEPAYIARQALEGMSLAERRRLMNMHMQGMDTGPLLQKHIEAELEEFQQGMAAFEGQIAENVQRLSALSNKLAQDLEGIGYLESLELQIETLSKAIKDLNPIAENLAGTITSTQEAVNARNAKIQALTAHLQQLQRKLRSPTAMTNVIYSVGNKISGYVVGTNYDPSVGGGQRFGSETMVNGPIG